MNCDRQRLLDFFYEEMEADDRQRFEKHLDDCPDCRRELAELTGTTRLLRSWPDEEPHLDLVFVREEGRSRRWLPDWALAGWRRFPVRFALSLAAVLLLFAVTDFQVTYQDGRFNLSFGAAPEHPLARIDELDRPVTRRDLLASQQQSLERIGAMLRDAEVRQQRELGLTLAQFTRQLERQRQQDMQTIGRSLQESAWYNETRFRRNEDVLQRLIPTAGTTRKY